MLGDVTWCLGFSEPGAGSDLAAVGTKAVLEDGRWVIDGQKIWTSYAHRADYMFTLVRTEPDEPRHAGISYLLIDMRQPGIEVRPLQQMTGGASFNEVFLTGATTPADHILGGRGEGWKVKSATLAVERAGTPAPPRSPCSAVCCAWRARAPGAAFRRSRIGRFGNGWWTSRHGRWPTSILATACSLGSARARTRGCSL